MSTRFIRLIILSLVTVMLTSGAAFAWQGRMAGMGDPYGLVADDSDFLTMPSKIVDGQGVKYYGDGRFLYHDVTDLNWSANLSGPISLIGTPPITGLSASGEFNSSGSLYEYKAMIGSAFPVSCGRMGIFFNYNGQSGDYDGAMALRGGPASDPGFISAFSGYNMDSSLDNFNLRIIYGQNISNDMKMGLELLIGYQQETNSYSNALTSVIFNGVDIASLYGVTGYLENDFIGGLFPFMKPYDSDYWEILMKAGLEGKFGPASVGMTARGGPLFGGGNTYGSSVALGIAAIPLSASNVFKLDGDVSGYKVGGDLWVRYPYSASISLPFTVRVDYVKKTRDGSGPGLATLITPTLVGRADVDWGYEHQETTLDIDAGGGFDMEVSKDLKVAAGIYYNYINSKDRFNLAMDPGLTILGNPLLVTLDDDSFPEVTEHLVKAKVVAEQNMGTWTLRGGLTGFAGWVTEDYSSSLGTPFLGLTNLMTNTGSLDGNIYGIVGNAGATFKARTFTIEPFIQAGYRSVSLDGPGVTGVLGGTIASVPWSLDKDRSEVLVGGGFSIHF